MMIGLEIKISIFPRTWAVSFYTFPEYFEVGPIRVSIKKIGRIK